MKHFWQEKRMKILIGIVGISAALMIYLGSAGKLSVFPQELLMALSVPGRAATAGTTNAFSSFFERIFGQSELQKENQRLTEENEALRRQLVDLDTYKNENKLFKESLAMQERNPQYDLVAAAVIGRDPVERYSGFTIDRGTLDSVAVNDPVLSSSGVVGRVVEVGPNYAKVATILDPVVNIGCRVSSTGDIGLLSGDHLINADGLCKLSMLPRDTEAKVGDQVVTTGLGGIFPPKLIAGTVEQLIADQSGKSMTALIRPTQDIASVKMVFVITHYKG